MMDRVLKKAAVTGFVLFFAAVQGRGRGLQKQCAVYAAPPQRGQLRGKGLLHRPILPDAAGIVQGVKFDFLRSQVQQRTGASGSAGVMVDFLPDEGPLNFTVIFKNVLVQTAPLQCCQGRGVILKKHGHVGGVGGHIAGRGGFSHRHAALQG